LGLPNEKTAALNGNHTEITKYASKDDDNFARVSGNIAKIVTKILGERMSGVLYP